MLLVSCVLVLCAGLADARPNIVYFLADDLGWNDVGFHGSNQIPTPNIDALAYSGIVLQNFYVAPVCTPSRSALMTGKYPIHTGEFFMTLSWTDDLILYLRFDTHLGIWAGKIDMYDHTNMETGFWGFDFRRGYEVADDLFGQYVTDIYTKEAVKLITRHNKSEPLFLMVSHSAMHSGNPSEFIRAPDAVIDKFKYINDTQRRKYAGVLTKLDESIGKVVESLQKQGLLNNTIIIFSTDNGGPAAGFNDNAASNYPLKGVKNTAWEGGIRGAALLWSPLLKMPSRVATQKLHIVDWLPTLYRAAGGDTSVFENIDGIDTWEALSEDLPSRRTDLVHNIDDQLGYGSITVGEWKVHKGTTYKGNWDKWYGPSGRVGKYDIELVYNSYSGNAIRKIGRMPSKNITLDIREAATIKCDDSIPITACKPLVAPCLYNVDTDPCERNNLANEKPDILQMMLSELEKVNQTALPPNSKEPDPLANPKYWGRVFTNFGDYEHLNEK
ncbi:arylsulfatase I [Trichoplusia ni]|uniref:Arylsulfatase I n=1 Tax=Trichoplusia ni TaxID=7111 RepID=A0A7E5WE54_TRINI|nr:arylsulfatase I [Trichoplusia ni]